MNDNANRSSSCIEKKPLLPTLHAQLSSAQLSSAQALCQATLTMTSSTLTYNINMFHLDIDNLESASKPLIFWVSFGFMQVPNSAYLRSDAAGVCHLQPVVPCCLRFPLQRPAPKGKRSLPEDHDNCTTAAYPSCFQLPVMWGSCKSVACHLYEGYSCRSAVREAFQQSAPLHAPVHAL